MSEVLPTFVMPNIRYNSEYTYFNRNNAGSLSRCHSLNGGCLATKSEGARSFCLHIIKLSDLCQTSLKAVQQRSFPKHQTSTKSLLTANNGIRPSAGVSAPVSPTCTRSSIRMWLSAELSSPTWRPRFSRAFIASQSVSGSRRSNPKINNPKRNIMSKTILTGAANGRIVFRSVVSYIMTAEEIQQECDRWRVPYESITIKYE